MNQPPLSLPSFAKVNWSLRILGKRPDGYHEVSTILQTISLHDDLHFEATADGAITMSCDDPEIPTDAQNLIVRAGLALRDRYRVRRGASIRVEKRIPAQGGLGGASANAALSLLALAHLWNINATMPALHEIAAKLGADVPFFLLGGRVRATGTGATLTPLPDAADGKLQYLIVIAPNARVATTDAYAALSAPPLTTTNTATILSSFQNEANSRQSQLWPLDSFENDFESVIFDIEPEIRRAKETLLQAGALGALLAGSGSSVFGIFADREDQQRAASEIKLEAGWRIFPCVTVSRNEYRRALGSLNIPFLRSFNFETDPGA